MAKPKGNSPGNQRAQRATRSLRPAEFNPAHRAERIEAGMPWLYETQRWAELSKSPADHRSVLESLHLLSAANCHLAVYFRAHYPDGIMAALRRERTYFNGTGRKQKIAYQKLIDETLHHAKKSLRDALRFANKRRMSKEQLNDFDNLCDCDGIDFGALSTAESRKVLVARRTHIEQQVVLVRFSEIVPPLIQLFLSPQEAFSTPGSEIDTYLLDARYAPARWGKWMFLSPSIRAYFEDADPETQLAMLMEIQPDPVADVPDKVGRTRGAGDRSDAPRQVRVQQTVASITAHERKRAIEELTKLGQPIDERAIQAFDGAFRNEVAGSDKLRPNTVNQRLSRARKKSPR